MGDETPLVSVLIPSFNRPQYLRETLRSVLEQSYPNTEILIQDNASAFDVAALVAEFADARISWRRNSANLGMALNWKALALRARGKYLAFVNDDDIWEKDFLAVLIERLERSPDLVVAFCDHWLTDATGRIDPARSDANSRRWQRDRLAAGKHQPFIDIALVYRSIWTATAAVFRRDAIDWHDIPEQSGVGVDLFIAYLAARTGGGAWYCAQRLARYRLHGGSTTSSFAALEPRLRCAESAVYSWRTFAEDRFTRSSAAYFRIKLAQNQFRYGVCRWLQGHPNLAPLAVLRLLSPGLFLSHLKYMVQLRRVRI